MLPIPTIYPPGTVRALLDSPHVSTATRQALLQRLQETWQPYEPCFFDPATFALLRAVCRRLLGQGLEQQPVEVAFQIDRRLHEKQADGWRFDALPPDAEAYQQGLRELQQAAQTRHGQDFAALPGSAQDALLAELEAGTLPGEAGAGLDGTLFFGDLLAEITSLYYAHPLVQEEMGYVGMADLPDWRHLRLNERDPREPEALL